MTSPPLPDPDPWLTGFELGEWQVDVSGNRLVRGDEVRPLRHKAMELLLLLARHAGRTVTRDQIVEAVWDGNQFVAPKAINTAVWTIRQTLGDDPDAPRYLETIAKKGYRLIAPVSLLADSAEPSATAPTPAPASDVPVATAPPAQRLSNRWPKWWPVATVAVVLGVALVALRLAPRSDTPSAGGSASAPAATSTSLVPPVPKPLTHELGIEYLGALSPDGKQLAFAWWRGRGVGELHLLRLDAADKTPQPLAAGHGDLNSLAWAPDGSAIAFAALGDDGRCRVWLQPLPPGAPPPAPRELAECARLVTPLLAWSPDGRQIGVGIRLYRSGNAHGTRQRE